MSITRFVTADGLPAFLAHLSKSARVLAPVEKPGNKTAVVFEPWKEGKPFTLAKATVPAKEAVLPQCEVLVRYSKTKDPNDPGKCTMTLDDTPQAEPTVVFGSRPCDARGYVTLDRPYLHGPFADPYYKARRDQLTVITLTCPSGCSTCFCHWVGGGPTSPEGSDVLMTEVEGGYVLQAMTDKGAALLAGHVGSPAGGVTEGLFLPFRAFPHRLRGGSEHLAHASQNGKLVFGAGRADRVFHGRSRPQFQDGMSGQGGAIHLCGSR